MSSRIRLGRCSCGAWLFGRMEVRRGGGVEEYPEPCARCAAAASVRRARAMSAEPPAMRPVEAAAPPAPVAPVEHATPAPSGRLCWSPTLLQGDQGRVRRCTRSQGHAGFHGDGVTSWRGHDLKQAIGRLQVAA